MEIWHVSYVGSNARNMVLLYLGDRNGKACCLETVKITDGDKHTINKSKTILAGLPLENKIRFILINCNNSYQQAYREISIGKLKIIKKYSI